MNGVLKTIRVLEQGTFITGPCAGMMLADLGADVIKVETPGSGDPYRSYKEGLYSAHFQAYNRNKRSLALDMKNDRDRGVFDQLIAEADVYIQNFRPGAADRLGAGYERLSRINPRLVYCSISGFGQDGPYAGRPVYDSVAQSVSGFLSVVVDPERPRFLGPALADAITGIYAAQGVLGALVERGVTGRGRLVEVSMLEAMTHFAVEPFAGLFALGEVPTAFDRPRLAQAHILKTSDGKLVAVHLSSIEKFWEGFTTALDAEWMRTDPRFATRMKRVENYEAMSAELLRITTRHDQAHWLARFAAADVPFAPVNKIDEVVEDPQVRHMGIIVPVSPSNGGGDYAVRPAVSYDGQRAKSVVPAPLLDQHGEAIRAGLARDGHWPSAGRDGSGAGENASVATAAQSV